MVKALMMSLGRYGLLLAACVCACSNGGSGPAADLVIDNARIWTVDRCLEDSGEIAPERWPEVEVDMTTVGGSIVYEREGR